MKSLQIAIAVVGWIVGAGCTPSSVFPTPICSMPLVIGRAYNELTVLRARPNEFSNTVSRKFQNVGSESVSVFFDQESDLLHIWDGDYKISYGEGITLDDGHEIEITFACSGGTPRTTVVSTTLQSNSLGTPIKTLFVCEIFEDEIVSKPDLIVQHWWDDALYVGYNEQETNVTGFHVINNGDAHAIVEFDYEHQQIQTRATVWNGIFPDRHYRQIIDPKGRAEFALSCFDMLPTYTETTISIYGIENEYTRHLVRTLKMTCAFNDFRSFPFSMTLSVPTPMTFPSESLATTTHQFKIRNAGIGNGRFKMDIPTGIHVVDEWGSEVTSNGLIDIARYHLRSFNLTVNAGVVPDNYAIILNDEGEWPENAHSVPIFVLPTFPSSTTTTTTPTTTTATATTTIATTASTSTTIASTTKSTITTPIIVTTITESTTKSMQMTTKTEVQTSDEVMVPTTQELKTTITITTTTTTTTTTTENHTKPTQLVITTTKYIDPTTEQTMPKILVELKPVPPKRVLRGIHY